MHITNKTIQTNSVVQTVIQKVDTQDLTGLQITMQVQEDTVG